MMEDEGSPSRRSPPQAGRMTRGVASGRGTGLQYLRRVGGGGLQWRTAHPGSGSPTPDVRSSSLVVQRPGRRPPRARALLRSSSLARIRGCESSIPMLRLLRYLCRPRFPPPEGAGGAGTGVTAAHHPPSKRGFGLCDPVVHGSPTSPWWEPEFPPGRPARAADWVLHV